jgi:hypothetical protein
MNSRRVDKKYKQNSYHQKYVCLFQENVDGKVLRKANITVKDQRSQQKSQLKMKSIRSMNFIWSILFFLPAVYAVLVPKWCNDVPVCGLLPWTEWTACSQSCGGGSQIRKREVCGLPEWNEDELENHCRKPLRIEYKVCNAECLNGGIFADGICI